MLLLLAWLFWLFAEPPHHDELNDDEEETNQHLLLSNVTDEATVEGIKTLGNVDKHSETPITEHNKQPKRLVHEEKPKQASNTPTHDRQLIDEHIESSVMMAFEESEREMEFDECPPPGNETRRALVEDEVVVPTACQSVESQMDDSFDYEVEFEPEVNVVEVDNNDEGGGGVMGICDDVMVLGESVPDLHAENDFDYFDNVTSEQSRRNDDVEVSDDDYEFGGASFCGGNEEVMEASVSKNRLSSLIEHQAQIANVDGGGGVEQSRKNVVASSPSLRGVLTTDRPAHVSSHSMDQNHNHISSSSSPNEIADSNSHKSSKKSKSRAGQNDKATPGRLENQQSGRKTIADMNHPSAKLTDFDKIMKSRKLHTDTMDMTAKVLGNLGHRKEKINGKKLSKNWAKLHEAVSNRAYLAFKDDEMLPSAQTSESTRKEE